VQRCLSMFAQQNHMRLAPWTPCTAVARFPANRCRVAYAQRYPGPLACAGAGIPDTTALNTYQPNNTQPLAVIAAADLKCRVSPLAPFRPMRAARSAPPRPAPGTAAVASARPLPVQRPCGPAGGQLHWHTPRVAPPWPAGPPVTPPTPAPPRCAPRGYPPAPPAQ